MNQRCQGTLSDIPHDWKHLIPRKIAWLAALGLAACGGSGGGPSLGVPAGGGGGGGGGGAGGGAGGGGGGTPATASVQSFSQPGAQTDPHWLVEDDGRTYLRMTSDDAATIVLAFAPDGSMRWQRELTGLYDIARASDGDLWAYHQTLTRAAKLRSSDGTIDWQNDYAPLLFGTWVVPQGPGTPPLDELTWSGTPAGAVALDGQLAFSATALGSNVEVLADGSRLLYGAGFVSRIDPSGTLAWERLFFTGLTGLDLDLRFVRALPGDSTFLFGKLDSTRVWFARLDAAGNVVEQTTLDSPFSTTLEVVTADTPNGFFLTTGAVPWLYHFDTNGSLIWQRHIETPEGEAVEAIIPRSGGGCYLAGHSFPGSEKDVWAAAGRRRLARLEPSVRLQAVHRRVRDDDRRAPDRRCG